MMLEVGINRLSFRYRLQNLCFTGFSLLFLAFDDMNCKFFTVILQYKCQVVKANKIGSCTMHWIGMRARVENFQPVNGLLVIHRKYNRF